MNKVARAILPALVALAGPLVSAAPTHAASISLDADVVRVVKATSSTVTFQVITSYNPEWRLAAADRGPIATYTSALPKADRSKAVLAKNAVIKVSGKISGTSGAVTLATITRTSGKCAVSSAPYNVVLCKASSNYYVRWTGSAFPIPATSRAMGKCSYSLGLLSRGAGPGVPLDQTSNGVAFGPADASGSVELIVSRSCKTTSQLGSLGTFSL